MCMFIYSQEEWIKVKNYSTKLFPTNLFFRVTTKSWNSYNGRSKCPIMLGISKVI